MTLTCDFAVIGSGLSGLNSVLAISRQAPGAKIILIEPQSTKKGASSAPMGLLNPSTSRSPNIIEDAEALIEQAKTNYADLVNHNNEAIMTKKGVLKAVPLGEDAGKWKEKYHKSIWPEGWSEWLDSEEIFSILGIKERAAPNGGIFIKEAYVVKMAELRASLLNKCKANLSYFIEESINSIDSKSKKIILKLDEIIYGNLLIANGYSIFNDNYFGKWITAHPIKGQMLTFESQLLNPDQSTITNSGYFGAIERNRFAIGSTYEHQFDHLDADEDGKKRLLKKLNHLVGFDLPIANINEIEQWTAVRVASKDRKPLIGAHPTISGLYLINGMASKGLIYSPTAANRLINFILGDKKALKNWDLQRYL